VEMTADSKGDSSKSERYKLGYVDKRYCLKGVAADGWQELKLSGYKGGTHPPPPTPHLPGACKSSDFLLLLPRKDCRL
jgi:hypothetical protein